MSETATELLHSLLEALPDWLDGRLADLGAARTAHAEAVGVALEEARRGLEELLARPFERQRAAPLEVVRSSLKAVTDSLAKAGVQPPPEDRAQEAVASDDPYGLAPASAAELGDAVLAASLAWGSEEALAMRRPLLLVVSSNLLDASRLERAAEGVGYRVEVSADPSPSVRPVAAFVDLETDGADDAIRGLAADGIRVIAYGPHVDDIAMVRARALGATDAEPRSRFFRDPTAHLPRLV